MEHPHFADKQLEDGRNLSDYSPVQAIKEAFDLFNANCYGRINARELKVAMRALGAEPISDDTRTIGYEDFLKMME